MELSNLRPADGSKHSDNFIHSINPLFVSPNQENVDLTLHKVHSFFQCIHLY